MANKKVEQLALIDVVAAEIKKKNLAGDTYRFKTSTSVDIEMLISEGEQNQLIVNNVLIAQKRAKDVVTGCNIKLKDNVFAPDIVQILQGGEVTYDGLGNFESYSAPLAGEDYKQEVFDLTLYTAHATLSGEVNEYMAITFPNCIGKAIQLQLEENNFFAPEYEMSSAPGTGQAPYKITVVSELPSFEVDEEESEAGDNQGGGNGETEGGGTENGGEGSTRKRK